MTIYSCCKSMFQVFHLNVAAVLWLYTHVSSECFRVFYMFQTYVASVSSEYSKIRSRCCICCKAKHACFKYFICFRHMLQAFSSGCFKSRSWEEHMLQLRGAAAAACGSTYVSKVYCCCVGHRAACLRCCCVHAGVGNRAGLEWSPRMRGHGRASCVRWVQAREFRTDRRGLRSGIGAGRGIYVCARKHCPTLAPRIGRPGAGKSCLVA